MDPGKVAALSIFCRARLAHSPQGSQSWLLPAPAKLLTPAHLARTLACQPGPPGGRRLSPRMAFVEKRLHGAARGPWRKIVLLSSELRGFAASREIRDLGPPGLPPPGTIACQASQPAQTTLQQARTAWSTVEGLLGAAGPQPAKIAKLEDRHESLWASFVPSCLCG